MPDDIDENLAEMKRIGQCYARSLRVIAGVIGRHFDSWSEKHKEEHRKIAAEIVKELGSQDPPLLIVEEGDLA